MGLAAHLGGKLPCWKQVVYPVYRVLDNFYSPPFVQPTNKFRQFAARPLNTLATSMALLLILPK